MKQPNSLLIFFFSGVLFVSVLVIGWLAIQNRQMANTISRLQNEASKKLNIVENTDRFLSPTAYETVMISQPLSRSDTTGWVEYRNNKYGFAINIPPGFQPTYVPLVSNNDWDTIGNRIQYVIFDYSPLDCKGDCPVIENTKAIKLAGRDMTEIKGRIGAIGGSIPQEYITIFYEKDKKFISFTFYSQPLDEPVKTTTTIFMSQKDQELYELIFSTLHFINDVTVKPTNN